MILTCNKGCKHENQDKLHGTGRRVHNEKKNGEFRCTVCGGTRSKKQEKSE